MYTLNATTTDPMLGLPPVFNSLVQSVSTSVAGFSTAGVPGFAPPEPGTFSVYQAISRHPTVALVRRMVTAPIIANTWGWMKKPGVPMDRLDFIRDMLEPQRHDILTAALRAIENGFAAFEKVWTVDGDRIVLSKLKALLPARTQILVDNYGNFAGLRNRSADNTSHDLLSNKSFLYTYDGECGNFYGRSRHENIRTIYSHAMQTANRMAQYHKKIAGVTAQLHYPEGTSRDAAGAERSNDLIAQDILEAVAMGKSVRFPNLFASIDDPRAAADLAGKSQWVLSQFDLGGADYSVGLLSALAYYDKQLFRGWLRPERVGLDTQHGSRADAQQHSESSILDSELIDQDFASAFNAGVIDQILTMNFGPDAKGSVWIDPSPISDSQTTTLKAMLAALLSNSQTAAGVAKQIDVAAVLDDLDVPVV